jgi:perosamine synthetase
VRLLPRFVPPAGTVLRASDVLAWLRDAAVGRDELRRLESVLEARYGMRHVYLVASARAGMTILLRAMAERAPGRPEVAMPGYTCYSVAASAVRAGLRVRPLDVDLGTLDIAPDALASADLGGAVALVGASLYGIPVDLPHLEATARAKGTALIDDAAQCLDGRIGGRWVGTFGDAGLFSFDKGKNITSIQGGVIVCRDADLAARLDRACGTLPAPARGAVALQGAKLLAYFVMLRPRLYWIANRLMRLGETPFELDAPMTGYPASLAPLVRGQLTRIEEITQGRIAHAERLREALDGTPGVRLPSRADARSVYPRFPVLFEDPARRDAVRRALVRAGIGATASYPQALIDVPEVQPHLAERTADTPRARQVAAGILTLPTHAFVTRDDLDRMRDIVRTG